MARAKAFVTLSEPLDEFPVWHQLSGILDEDVLRREFGSPRQWTYHYVRDGKAWFPVIERSDGMTFCGIGRWTDRDLRSWTTPQRYRTICGAAE